MTGIQISDWRKGAQGGRPDRPS